MDILKLERTEHTPEIVLDADELILSIKGVSRPKNAKSFYDPITNWLEDFSIQHPRTSAPLSIEVKLSYLNSGSFKYLVEFFKLIKKIHEGGMKVLIEWYYKDDDEIIRELGLEISDIAELPFTFIED
jgi:hypothetical protein